MATATGSLASFAIAITVATALPAAFLVNGLSTSSTTASMNEIVFGRDGSRRKPFASVPCCTVADHLGAPRGMSHLA